MKLKKTFNRADLKLYPLEQCSREVAIVKDRVLPSFEPHELSEEAVRVIRQTADDILEAKQKGASRILTFGSELIYNGLGPLIGKFVERGWLTHLATTGTSVVDDWEFAYSGSACEDSRINLPEGNYGMWQEPGYFINLAILVGAWEGLGLGQSIGKMIAENSIEIPDVDILRHDINTSYDAGKVSAAAELLNKIEKYDINPGLIEVPHEYRDYSLQYFAYKHNIPFTVHPQFGLDIFFMNPLCSFASVGRTAEADFLYFVNSVDNLDNGVYLSVGSSIASPMMFEKALSMSQNVRIQEGRRMTNHKIVVVDLAESKWDWMKNGEPPETRPEYYLRYCKSFSRAKAKTMYYVSADNRDFFLTLYRILNVMDK